MELHRPCNADEFRQYYEGLGWTVHADGGFLIALSPDSVRSEIWGAAEGFEAAIQQFLSVLFAPVRTFIGALVRD